jgi:hypothetical protein
MLLCSSAAAAAAAVAGFANVNLYCYCTCKKLAVTSHTCLERVCKCVSNIETASAL